MEFKFFMMILSKRKWFIILTTVVTLVIVILYILLTKPVYESTTTLRIASSSIASGDYNQFLYAERLLNTYAEIASSTIVREELMKRLSLSELPEINVRALPDTELIKITAASSSPQMAFNIATTLNNILIEQSQNFYLGGRYPVQDVINQQISQIANELQQAQADYAKLAAQPGRDPQALASAKQLVDAKETIYLNLLNQYDQDRVQRAVSSNVVSIMDNPTVPAAPARPQVALDLLLGLIVGLVGGLGLAMIMENLDPGLYSTGQIEDLTGLTCAAEIPQASKNEKFKGFIGHPPPFDSFHSLRNHLMNGHYSTAVKRVLVTSAMQSEGKTTILLNLAYAMAQTGKNVLIVDSNMRHPTLHTMLDCRNDLGLSSLLKHNVAPEMVTVASRVPGICVIPSGPPDRYPANLLDSETMKSLIHDLGNQFDLVLLDSPSLLSEIDAEIMAPFVDAVLLVVNRRITGRDQLQNALKHISKVRSNDIAVVINGSSNPIRHRVG